MTTLVYLLRHGATALNRLVPYRLQGRGSDPSLDPEGQDQARRAAGALATLPITAVYTSPLARAFETAAIVALPHRLDPVAVPALIEADIGRWEGLTWTEAQAQDPDQHARFHADPGATAYPDGESFLDVSRRVGPTLADLADAHLGEQIIVVGHNVVNRAYLATLLGLPIDLARSLRQSNGGINLIQYDGPSARVVTLNATLHL
ncbi:MAG: histidine phosphatase family protein [Isosphaeraceae bacterium]